MSAYIPAASHHPAPSRTVHMTPAKESTPAPAEEDTGIEIESDDSFIAALMATLVTSNQSFSASGEVVPENKSTMPTLKYGGTFNMEPAFLVLPEGVSTDALVSTDTSVTFNDALISALTPAVPNDCDFPAEGADPRLIAAGLSPADMTDLLAKLAAMKKDPSTLVPVASNNPTPVTEGSLAIVSFLPEAAMAKAAPVPAIAIDTSLPPVQVSLAKEAPASAPASAVANPVAQALAMIEPGSDQPIVTDGDFDPVEFRLSSASSRYGSVNLYATVAPQSPVAAPVAASVSAAVTIDAAIKGTMQAVGGGSDGPAFTSALSAGPSASVSGSLLTESFDPLLATTMLSATPAQSGGLTNPVLQNIAASQPQPAAQAVAALIVRNANNGPGTQTLAVQLDPPELGKLQLKMRYERGEPLKVHVVLEKADTLAMFQRNAHALENALNQAGIQTDSSSLTFDLAHDQNAFEQTMQDGQKNSSGGTSSWTSSEAAEVIESRMDPVYTDPKTGLTHYNIYA